MKPHFFRNPTMSGSNENDWHEDFEHENGNYFNSCCVCGVDFLGHKRRSACRVCHTKFVDKYESLPEQEKAEFLKEQEEMVYKIWKNFDFSGKKKEI